MSFLPSDHHFGISTLPYGVFTTVGGSPRVGVRIVDEVLDLAAVSVALDHPDSVVFRQPSLNALMALGSIRCAEIRSWVRSLVEPDQPLPAVRDNVLPLGDVTMLLPVEVGDYVDFYASEKHASNVGKIFRPDSPDLPANWKHLPIGYHGRSGTVVVSGTDVVRPRGQSRPTPDGVPSFGPTRRLDIECEVGFIVGTASALGTSVGVAEARDHIFGLVLLNDWSARDIQAWEYVPLGPFLGKSFATSISAWVVPLEAFVDAELTVERQSPPVLPYLDGNPSELFGLDLHLTVAVNGHPVSSPEFREMYWSPAQMLAHMTVNGASLRVGDLFASGTVSGESEKTFGSLLELTWNGTHPIELGTGERQGFLADGDTVTLTGWAPSASGGRVTLGEVTGTIVASPR